jgi:type II secretory pathway pseudopilin PulG
VLATLLLSALSTAKRKARQTVSVGNLRQIGLAFNMYADDHRKRPWGYAPMIQEKYLTTNSLLCAEDKLTGNWAGIIENSTSARTTTDGSSVTFIGPDVPHSYFRSFALADEVWDRIDKDPLAGIAACQLHGIGRQSLDTTPSLYAYQGLVFRGLKDTSVVKRQVFWAATTTASGGDKNSFAGGGISTAAPTTSADASGGATPADLPLFLDNAQ